MNGNFDYGRHWRQWDWQAKNPGEWIYNWPGAKNYPVAGGGFAMCDAAKLVDSTTQCLHCPVAWENWMCMSPGSSFRKFYDAKDNNDLEQVTKLAIQIRDMELC